MRVVCVQKYIWHHTIIEQTKRQSWYWFGYAEISNDLKMRKTMACKYYFRHSTWSKRDLTFCSCFQPCVNLRFDVICLIARVCWWLSFGNWYHMKNRWLSQQNFGILWNPFGFCSVKCFANKNRTHTFPIVVG